MLSGISVFLLEFLLGGLEIDKKVARIEYYMFGLAAYGLIACSVTYFFPYRINNFSEFIDEKEVLMINTGENAESESVTKLNHTADTSLVTSDNEDQKYWKNKHFKFNDHTHIY